MSEEKIDVLVAGAGPVGLIAALSLAKAGVNVKIIDRDDRAGTHSYALALHGKTQELLVELGIGQSLWNNGYSVNRIGFGDLNGDQIELDVKKASHSNKGLLVVGQDHLEIELEKACERMGVQIMWSHRLSDLKIGKDQLEVEVEQLTEGLSGYASARLEWQVMGAKRLKSPFIIGSDGHTSFIRRSLGIDFPKIGETQSFAVFEFKTNANLKDVAHLSFTDKGMNILWPLPGGYCRWAFQVDDNEGRLSSRNKDRLFVQVGSHGFQHLESGQLEEFIKSRTPWFKGSIGPMRWRMIVRFERRLAERFGDGRIWLAGDAAHLAAPFGMQSMNLGMQESVRLARIMAEEIKSGICHQAELENYSLERFANWKTILGLSGSLVGNGQSTLFLNDHLKEMTGCLPCGVSEMESFANALGLKLEIEEYAR